MRPGDREVRDRPPRARLARAPLYLQLRDALWEQIEGGGLRPGDPVPSERELCLQYGISRMTCRQAIGELVAQGVLYRRRGKGTYVANPKISQSLLELTSFTEDMIARGITPGAIVLEAREVVAPPRVAAALDLQGDRTVVQIERLRTANSQPMALETSHLPARLCPGLADGDGLSGSLYQLVRTRYGIEMVRARQSLEAVTATRSEAVRLGVKAGSPLLSIERISYDRSGRPVEYVRSLYRGDRYRFDVELVRTGLADAMIPNTPAKRGN